MRLLQYVSLQTDFLACRLAEQQGTWANSGGGSNPHLARGPPTRLPPLMAGAADLRAMREPMSKLEAMWCAALDGGVHICDFLRQQYSDPEQLRVVQDKLTRYMPLPAVTEERTAGC